MDPKTTLKILCLSLVLCVAAGAVRAGDDASDAERGRHVYNRSCAACHGFAGDGQGAAADYLSPRPRDFTLGIYKFRSTSPGMPPTDDDLFRTVTEGVPTTTMPAYGSLLGERERRDVVAYIKTFSDNFVLMPAGNPISIPDEPAATAESISDGRNIYVMNACWTCHGPAGRGDGDAANVLTDVWGEVIVPVDFTRGRYKSGHGNEDLFRTVETGIMGTPMPGYAEGFAYASDTYTLPSSLNQVHTAEEIAEAQRYIDAQPTKAELEGMSDDERNALIARRKWALVHYLRSLAEEPSIWQKLFAVDTEVTR